MNTESSEKLCLLYFLSVCMSLGVQGTIPGKYDAIRELLLNNDLAQKKKKREKNRKVIQPS